MMDAKYKFRTINIGFFNKIIEIKFFLKFKQLVLSEVSFFALCTCLKLTHLFLQSSITVYTIRGVRTKNK